MSNKKLGAWELTEYEIFLIETVGSISAGLIVSGIILAVLGYNPIRGLSLLLLGGLRNPDYLLSRATFIMMTGLAFAIPLYAGLFNINGEGEMYIGGLVALLTAIYTGNGFLAILAGGVAGAALGLLVSALRVYRGVNEVVTAIMLNMAIYYTIIYLITSKFYDPVAPHESVKVPVSARLGTLNLVVIKIHVIFLLALAFIALSYYFLYFTKLGYEIRVSGLSPASARYAGINSNRAMINSMTFGGFFAGVGGALNVVGFMYYIDSLLTSMHGMGFDGIGVALMGRNNPLGIVLASIFFSMLILGSQRMQLLMRVPKELADALSGVIIIAFSLPYAYRMLISYLRTRRMIKIGAEQYS